MKYRIIKTHELPPDKYIGQYKKGWWLNWYNIYESYSDSFETTIDIVNEFSRLRWYEVVDTKPNVVWQMWHQLK